MNPDFISGAELADTCPSRKLHIVPFAALLVHDHPRDIRRAVPLLPSGTNMENFHFVIHLYCAYGATTWNDSRLKVANGRWREDEDLLRARREATSPGRGVKPPASEHSQNWVAD